MSTLLIPNAINFGLDSHACRVDETFIAIHVDFDVSVYVDCIIAIGDGIVHVDVYSYGGGGGSFEVDADVVLNGQCSQLAI